MKQNQRENLYLFSLVQNLGVPSIFPPVTQGKIPASVQFIIPGFTLSKIDKKYITQLSVNCGMDLWRADTNRVENKRTKKTATLVTFAFYVVPTSSEDENSRVILSTSRLLVERFLGLLSFFAGMKLSFVNLQVTTVGKEEGHYKMILPSTGRSYTPPIPIKFPTNLDSIVPPENVFSALFWLRRGLAERDPIETFSAFMVCLQIMARHIEPQEPTVTSQMRKLIVSRLGRSPDLFERLWEKARNAIVAHGNKPVTPGTLLELTELKFETAILAYQSIKLSLGMPLDSPPLPQQSLFITDDFMYVD